MLEALPHRTAGTCRALLRWLSGAGGHPSPVPRAGRLLGMPPSAGRRTHQHVTDECCDCGVPRCHALARPARHFRYHPAANSLWKLTAYQLQNRAKAPPKRFDLAGLFAPFDAEPGCGHARYPADTAHCRPKLPAVSPTATAPSARPSRAIAKRRKRSPPRSTGGLRVIG
jgi:hypothetical protein